MKKTILRTFLVCLFALTGADAFAYNVAAENEDGVTIYYNYINDNTELEVTYEFFSLLASYAGNVKIPESVTIGGTTYKVTSIGEQAFSWCDKLTSITIPASITSIGNWAFYGCSGLEKVIVKDIAAWCGISLGDGYSNPFNFAHHLYSDEDTEITDLVIPDGVTNIGDWAFGSCSSLTSVSIPASMKSLGRDAFSYCTGLTSFIIPDGVTNIGIAAFAGCTGLTSIAIPDGVTSIEERTFWDCTGLTSVIIPASVTSIGYEVFWNCSGLTEVTIPDGVTSIGDRAFLGCDGLTAVTIPASVTSIGDGAFSSCSSLEKIIVKDIAAWCGFSFANEASNPLWWAHHLYSDENTEITDLVIPDGVTSIGNYAFCECNGLTSVTIPDGVTSIGDRAFYECNGLTSVTIPASMTSIGDWAFAACWGLEKVIVKDIAAWCGISFTNSPSNPLWCGHHLYSDENTEITDLVIPDGVTSIGNYAFNGCGGLTSVTIPDGVTSVGGWAFSECSGLTSVTISDDVTSLGQDAFSYCTGLTSFTIPDGVTNVSIGAFAGCTGLTSIAIPGGVTSIDERAFWNCTGLTSVAIHEGVTNIGYEVFWNCSGLTEVTIPASMTSIGQGAFNNCSGLASVISLGTTPPEVDFDTYDTFYDKTYQEATLYVPEGSKALYEQAGGWQKFLNIQEQTGTVVSVNANGLATYCPVAGIDFSGATAIAAYKASVSDNTVKLTRVETVAAGEGVLLCSLNGGAASEQLPTIEATANADNAFVGTTETVTLSATDGNVTNFVLSKVDGVVGFFKANDTPLTAGKAYLPVENYDAARGLTITFDDNTTGISEVAPVQPADDAFYTLDGVRVTAPAKGLYIKNGKKVFIK